jgi:hypothetical protein
MRFLYFKIIKTEPHGVIFSTNDECAHSISIVWAMDARPELPGAVSDALPMRSSAHSELRQISFVADVPNFVRELK